MTEEELGKEAEDYANHNDWFEFSANVDKIGNAIKTKMERAYLASAEPREKRIAELETQIEKMKCCGNCIHCKYDENEESYEFCEKHNQVVNIAIQPCSEYETYNFDKAIKEIKEK